MHLRCCMSVDSDRLGPFFTNRWSDDNGLSTAKLLKTHIDDKERKKEKEPKRNKERNNIYYLIS